MAGESAREVARRQREKGERSAAWERGADGEEATAAALLSLPAGWTVFHDVRWPGRKYANVDHVAVGPGGVFVIDSKNWSGSIVVRDNVLRQNGRQRELTVSSAAEAALAVHRVVPAVVSEHVMAVLCFVRDEPLSGWARDVMYCSTANVVQLLLTRPAVLPPHVLTEACLQLDAMFRSASAPRQAVPVRPGRSARPRRTGHASRPSSARMPVARSRPLANPRPPSRKRRVEGPARSVVLALVAMAVLSSLQPVVEDIIQFFLPR